MQLQILALQTCLWNRLPKLDSALKLLEACDMRFQVLVHFNFRKGLILLDYISSRDFSTFLVRNADHCDVLDLVMFPENVFQLAWRNLIVENGVNC